MNDFHRNFILNDIEHGFDNANVTSVSCKNHNTASPSSPLYDKATSQVIEEIQNGHYVTCDTPPKIVSPMAAFPKPDGGIRLIHDCSRPEGESVNDYCSVDWQQKFARVDDAAALMTEGCYFAKVDLKSAYLLSSVNLVRV